MRKLFATAVAGAALVLAAAPAPAATLKRTGARSYELTVPAPASPDLSVIRLDFRLGARATRGRTPLWVAPRSDGIDLAVAAGRLFPWRKRTLIAFVVVAHRHPRGALYPDVAEIRLGVGGARLTHRPVVEELANAFARRSSASPAAPAPCRDRAGKVTDDMVRALGTSGPAWEFPPAHVLAEAFDIACSRPVDPAFERAFTQYDRCPPPCDPRFERPCPLAAAAAYPCIEPA